MANYWIKFYTEVLDDPKVATLPDRLWRRFYELCLIACKHDDDGYLPEVEQIAWMLRQSPDEIDQNIADNQARVDQLQKRIEGLRRARVKRFRAGYKAMTAQGRLF